LATPLLPSDHNGVFYVDFELGAGGSNSANLDFNFSVVICVPAIIAFRQEITKLCRSSAVRARFAFGNNFDCAKCDQGCGDGVR
jgi:hypothetical protein